MKRFSSQVIVAIFLGLTMLLAGCGDNGSHSSYNSHGTDSSIQMGGAIQGEELVLTGETATIIGANDLQQEGYRTSVALQSPYGITSDGTNLYVSEMYNHLIHKIVIASGEVTTLAGVAGEMGSHDSIDGIAQFNMPLGITTDGTNLYVCEGGNHTIRQVVIATGVVSTLAGSAGNEGSVDGIGTAAQFGNPNSVATDGTNLYVTDLYNHTVRQIVLATGEVTTLAGSAGEYGSSDGIGSAAKFSGPNGIATDGTNLYVVEPFSNTIRKIVIASAEVTTLAGSAGSKGSSDGVGSAAQFNTPRGCFLNGNDLYVTEGVNNTLRKVVTTTGEVTTLAGFAMEGGANDGIGTEARFKGPRGVTLVGSDLYVCDYENNLLRAVDISTPENVVVTFAGFIAHIFGDMTTDGSNLYASDAGTRTIQKIEIATGEITTLTGRFGTIGSTDGDVSSALFNDPMGITTDGTNLYVCDYSDNTIRKISIETGEVSTLAGSAGTYGSADGTGSAAEFASPYGITTDGINLYVTDMSNLTIRQIVIATGEVSTLAGSVGNSGSDDGIGSAARFNFPLGLTTDGTNLYVADYYNNAIRQVVIATGAVTTLASGDVVVDLTDDSVSDPLFTSPISITTDGTNLYVTDSVKNIIFKIVIATGMVTTVTGNADSSGSTDGSASVALFNGPRGVISDGTTLYVLDSLNKIRSIR